MPAMSVSTTPAADEIERQMRALRSELREDVHEIVENARVMADWQYYVRTYPWLCLGAAAALGFVLVPSRVHVVKPDAAALAELVRQHQVKMTDSPLIVVSGTVVPTAPQKGHFGGTRNLTGVWGKEAGSVSHGLREARRSGDNSQRGFALRADTNQNGAVLLNVRR